MQLLLVLTATGLGCILAAALGLPASILLDSAIPAGLAITFLPALGTYVGGIRVPQQLAKIALYALTVWVLCSLLEPVVARATTDGERVPDFTWWYGAMAFVPASLLALIGAGFASRQGMAKEEQVAD
ncbi:hypothetical protein [Aeoliella sp. SH292]|jgi:hypothetical protein|uniref:hypothetical protein n=1 Tax=Aeoliella sp. SH292 TaxID=3454464 RepID=UPI003F97A779